MKKLSAILICLVMVLSMSVTAFAVDSSTETGFTVTIKDALQGETYNVYKIFDLTYSGDVSPTPDPSDDAALHLRYAYSIGTGSQWWSDVTDAQTGDVIYAHGLKFTKSADNAAIYTVEEMTAAELAAYNEGKDASAQMAAFSAADFAAYLGTKTSGKSADKTATPDKTAATQDPAKVSPDLTFNGLTAGYYFATTTGSVFSLNTAEPNAVLKEKNSTPSFDKKVKKDGEEDSAYGTETNQTIGKTVNFKIEITDGTNTDKAITLHDTMSTGLTLTRKNDGAEPTPADTTFSITVDDVAVPAANYSVNYTPGDDCTFEIVFNAAYVKTLDANKVIVIKYDAVVNENAKIKADPTPDYNPNKAHIDYSNQSYVDKEVKVYSYKADVVKYDGTDGAQKAVLDGAEFKLYDAQTAGNVIDVYKVSDGVYRVVDKTVASPTAAATAITTKDGQFKIEGLGNGTYWLEETKAPNGFNKLAARQSFTINGANLDATVTDAKYVRGGVGIENKSGSELPSTGNIGTTIFYIVGGVLVLGAVVVIVAKKRTKARED